MQFVGLLLVLAGIYYIYNYWWVDQDRSAWINRMNDNIYESEDEMDANQPPPPKSDGWL
jgi:hypothetical protein